MITAPVIWWSSLILK